MTATCIIDAQGVTRQDPANGKLLLAPTHFSLCAGTRLAIMGPSGSGKSVLLRALALLDPLDGGRVLWHGRTIRRHAIPRYRRSVAYLRQRPAHAEGTVESMLRYPYSLAVYRDRQFDRARVAQLALHAGRSPDFLDKRASELSGGEAQIAALLRVLHLDPDVLLLDEPTSALDPDATRAIEALVGAWFDAAPETRAYMWISHDPAQAARIGAARMTMHAGVLRAADTAEVRR